MKMKYMVLFLFWNCLFYGVAQTEITPCATSQKMDSFISSLSSHDRALYDLQREDYEQQIQEYVATHHEALLSDVHQKTIQFTIPVVFHIIHEGGSENISMDQIINEMEHLNNDYQMLNSDLSNTVSYFQSRIANIKIAFKLAKLDPNGNCTNGVTRTYSHSSLTGNTQEQVQAVKNAHGIWPGDQYLNVFVARNIGGAAGFTMYPNNWLGSSMNNGIHILDTYTGTIGTADWRGAHTLTHEVGHWLNLSHVWGDSNEPGLASNCSVDDHVEDTPNTRGWTICDLNGQTCSDTASFDNVQNFMEYSYCSTMFTEGQKIRMHAALNSSVGGRNNIWSAQNLANTGVNLPSTLCKANFSTPFKVVCQGESVELTDLSYGNVTSWNWSFQGANPSTSTDQNPTIVYNSPGIYPISLVVSDGSSSISITKETYIKVLPESSILPYKEDFEAIDTLQNSNIEIRNSQIYSPNFVIIDGPAYSGGRSVILHNYIQEKGFDDAIITPRIDLSNVNPSVGATFSFRYAYRKKDNTLGESINIAYSKDCGKTWSVFGVLSGNNFEDRIEYIDWEPNSKTDWRIAGFSIPNSFLVDNLRIKIQFFAQGGNNLFIDDINVYEGDLSHMAVIDNQLIQGMTVYPNPADAVSNIAFNFHQKTTATLDVVSLTGQMVFKQSFHTQQGQNIVSINTDKLDAGVYLIKLNIAGHQQVRRIVVE